MKLHIIIFILNLFDFFYKLKILNFLKKRNFFFNTLIDVGGHHGETVKFFLKNFKIKNIYSFEPSPINYKILQKECLLLQNKYINSKIFTENQGLSNVEGKFFLKQFKDSSSSTLNKINKKSIYYTKKNKIFYSKKDKNIFKKIEVRVTTLAKFIIKKKIRKIDFLKIDTEGYEYKVFLGLKKNISKVNFIMFEHHYDDMIIKNYNFSEVNNFLIKNNFKKIFKVKMPFRKTFEYIYENNKKLK